MSMPDTSLKSNSSIIFKLTCTLWCGKNSCRECAKLWPSTVKNCSDLCVESVESNFDFPETDIAWKRPQRFQHGTLSVLAPDPGVTITMNLFHKLFYFFRRMTAGSTCKVLHASAQYLIPKFFEWDNQLPSWKWRRYQQLLRAFVSTMW